MLASSQQFANTVRLSTEDLKSLTKADQLSYRDGIRSASDFWQAKLTLEANQDFKVVPL